MNCAKCGAENPPGKRFCGDCGVALASRLLPRLRDAQARLAGRGDRAMLEAGLREAEGMYRAMGAPDPAERLAKELRI
jgi:hypothetical protein